MRDFEGEAVVHIHVKEIVLWPRTAEEPPRRLKFQTGVVNVITGASKTGKSSIIPIIDYCLGSDTCTIPVNTIRQACSWFGVVIQTDVGEKLFARREPGAQKSTGDMYVLEGATISIPEKIVDKNATVDIVKQRLNELAGLTQLDFTQADFAGAFKKRPSFRDMVAFVFQPQNIVANPNALFYKADTYEHQEKLRTIFPYVLGAVTPLTLAKQHELAALRLVLRRKETELNAVQQVSERWLAEIKSKVTTAVELGLLASAPADNTPLSEIVEALRSVSKQEMSPRVSTASIDVAVTELSGLTKEERELSVALSQLRRRYSDMTQLRDASGEYGQALGVKRDRLKIADWLNELYRSKGECLLCGGRDQPQERVLNELYGALKQVESQASDFRRVPAAFEREFERIRGELGHITEQLEGVRLRRKVLEDRSSAAKRESYSQVATAYFIGGLREALSRLERIGTDGDLIREVQTLKEKIAGVEAELRRLDARSATARALDNLTAYMGRTVPELDVERPNDAVKLSIEDLSIKVVSAEREDYLWEIGSGANWVGYHIAVSLALQNLFLGHPYSPVPSFLVYDQPSQVYFPRRLVSKDDDKSTDDEPELLDEDVAAVRKIFALVANEILRQAGKLQAIILDHAAQDVWGGIAGIHVVEEWRDGLKLVPESWYADS